MKHSALTATVLLCTLGAGPALAEVGCNVPMADWQPRQAVQKMIESRGWIAGRIGTDDGCYEIRARDADGREIEAKVDPATLEILGHKSEGRHGGDDESDDNEHGAPARSGSAPGTGPAPNNGLFKGGSRPSVVVK